VWEGEEEDRRAYASRRLVGFAVTVIDRFANMPMHAHTRRASVWGRAHFFFPMLLRPLDSTSGCIDFQERAWPNRDGPKVRSPIDRHRLLLYSTSQHCLNAALTQFPLPY
jgi:hypothetical protein